MAFISARGARPPLPIEIAGTSTLSERKPDQLARTYCSSSDQYLSILSQCIAGLGKQPSYGAGITRDCTSKDNCGQSWTRRWWTLRHNRSCRQPTDFPQRGGSTSPPKLPRRKRKEHGGRAKCKMGWIEHSSKVSLHIRAWPW